MYSCSSPILLKKKKKKEKKKKEKKKKFSAIPGHLLNESLAHPHIIVDFPISQHQPWSQGPCMSSSFSRWLHLLSRFQIPTASPSVSLLVPANHGPYNNIIPAPIVPILAQHKRLRHSSLTLPIPTSTQLLQLRVS